MTRSRNRLRLLRQHAHDPARARAPRARRDRVAYAPVSADRLDQSSCRCRRSSLRARRADPARARGGRTDLRKLGEALSVRPDLLSPEVGEELAKLQDQVPPFPGELAVETLERAFGKPVGPDLRGARPHAARGRVDRASHAAKLRGRHGRGRQGAPAERRGADRARPRGAVRDRGPCGGVLSRGAAAASERGGRRIREDAVQRARHDARGRERFAAQAQLRGLGAPARAGDLLGLLPAERLDDGADLRNPRRRRRGAARRGHGHPPLAENGVEIFFTQVFRHNFFHADMHRATSSSRDEPARAQVRRGGLRHRRHARRAR